MTENTLQKKNFWHYTATSDKTMQKHLKQNRKHCFQTFVKGWGNFRTAGKTPVFKQSFSNICRLIRLPLVFRNLYSFKNKKSLKTTTTKKTPRAFSISEILERKWQTLKFELQRIKNKPQQHTKCILATIYARVAIIWETSVEIT